MLKSLILFYKPRSSVYQVYNDSFNSIYRSSFHTPRYRNVSYRSLQTTCLLLGPCFKYMITITATQPFIVRRYTGQDKLTKVAKEASKLTSKTIGEHSSVLSSQATNISNPQSQSTGQSSSSSSASSSTESSPNTSPSSSPQLTSKKDHYKPMLTVTPTKDKYPNVQSKSSKNTSTNTNTSIQSKEQNTTNAETSKETPTLVFTPYVPTNNNQNSGPFKKSFHLSTNSAKASVSHVIDKKVNSTSSSISHNVPNTDLTGTVNNVPSTPVTASTSSDNSLLHAKNPLNIAAGHPSISHVTKPNSNNQQTLFVDNSGVSHNHTESTTINPISIPTKTMDSNNNNSNNNSDNNTNNKQILYMDNSGVSHNQTEFNTRPSTPTYQFKSAVKTIDNNNNNSNNNNSNNNNVPITRLYDHKPSSQITNKLFSTDESKKEFTNKSANIGMKTEDKVKEFEDKMSYKTITGKLYTTSLNKTSNPSNITDKSLLEELTKRELFKNDKDKTEVPLKLESGEDYTLGFNKQNVKLTQLGQAYIANIEKNKDITLFPNQSNSTTNVKFEIIVGPINSNTFIESGKQKHMLAAYDKNTNEYNVIGYFTSKKSGELFSEQQFKVFQLKLENPDTPVPDKGKSQYFVPLDNAESIPVNDVKVVKGGTDYIKNCKKEQRLTTILNQLEKEPFREFNSSGISKEDCINMCLEHDKNVKSKKPHPLTKDQIKMNELNKEKQKELNLSKNNKTLDNNEHEIKNTK